MMMAKNTVRNEKSKFTFPMKNAKPSSEMQPQTSFTLQHIDKAVFQIILCFYTIGE